MKKVLRKVIYLEISFRQEYNKYKAEISAAADGRNERGCLPVNRRTIVFLYAGARRENAFKNICRRPQANACLLYAGARREKRVQKYMPAPADERVLVVRRRMRRAGILRHTASGILQAAYRKK